MGFGPSQEKTLDTNPKTGGERPEAGLWPRLFGQGRGRPRAVVYDPAPDLTAVPSDPAGLARALTAAFLIRLTGPGHALAQAAEDFLSRCAGDPEWSAAAALFRDALEFVPADFARAAADDPAFAERLRALEAALPAGYSAALQELLWSVFFPEGAGIRGRESERVEELRRKRLVRVTGLNPSPLTDPVREILFTSNVLLAPPRPGADLESLRLEPDVRRELARIMAEPQAYWYDHPVRVGTPPEQNEVLYGLRHLDEALDWEIRKGRTGPGTRAACVLSVSVTHRGLGRIARAYLQSELALAGGLKHIDVYVFTEEDARRLLERTLVPLAGGEAADALAEVFGVDGPYGRHYSFLKAIAALWQAFVDPGVRAVFKIDLDQVFPEAELEREAGGSMADLFRTPLWGARGTDADGAPVELGMIAGALVNENEIACGLFTPDVTCAGVEPVSHERLFWSRLPQALSTEAEMTARYGSPPLDGRTACLERVHVTGGTNGISIEALRRHRPFTPSFIGRAEDQAYLMSTFGREGPRLAYVHRPGLVMRHDKDAFAGEAVRAARAGKAVGDIVRVLQFSAYARALGDVAALKRRFDPFTGCFVSRIPRVVALLRFALEAALEFREGRPEAGTEFVRSGASRLSDELAFTDASAGELERRLAREREGWAAFFEGLSAAESLALGPCRAAARDVIQSCRIRA
jgi:hypothetical protein